jgi:hypothetical protein
MSPDVLFSLSSSAAMAGWVVLVAAPRRWPLVGAVPRWAIPVALSVLYAVLVPVHFAATGGGYGSIEAVRRLFASDAMLVGGWVHYLAFDLLVGAFVADRMDRAGVHRVVQAGPLVAIFLFGPIGFLLALATELLARRAAPAPRSSA